MGRFARTDPRLFWLADAPEQTVTLVGTIVKIASKTDFDCDDPRLRRLLSTAITAASAERPSSGGSLEFDELSIRTPGDVAGALKLMMTRAGLGPGQIAVRTHIHRSQVYHLSNPVREALPRTHDQLLACLEACRTPRRQIEVILLQWLLLRERRRAGLPLLLPGPAVTTPPADTADVDDRLERTVSAQPDTAPRPAPVQPVEETVTQSTETEPAGPFRYVPMQLTHLTALAIAAIVLALAIAFSAGPVVIGFLGASGVFPAHDQGGARTSPTSSQLRHSQIPAAEVSMRFADLAAAVDAARADGIPPDASAERVLEQYGGLVNINVGTGSLTLTSDFQRQNTLWSTSPQPTGTSKPATSSPTGPPTLTGWLQLRNHTR
ncbi:hypothetical protein ACFWMR_07310 [Amycolatopsis thailandensis]|uniref:hypothetical protein n=1 Tax=Amycolatopsis thailandensis TaxID=589330 RepID=UPI00366763AE